MWSFEHLLLLLRRRRLRRKEQHDRLRGIFCVLLLSGLGLLIHHELTHDERDSRRVHERLSTSKLLACSSCSILELCGKWGMETLLTRGLQSVDQLEVALNE